MYQVSIQQAETQLSKLVEEAAQGEVIIIAKAGIPIAKLVPVGKIETKLREPGGMKGQIWMADDFDEPMSEEELALWYDAPIFPKEG